MNKKNPIDFIIEIIDAVKCDNTEVRPDMFGNTSPSDEMSENQKQLLKRLIGGLV